MAFNLRKHIEFFDTLDLGFICRDHNCKFIEANNVAEKILGVSKAQMEDPAILLHELQATREDGSPFPGRENPSLLALSSGKKVKNVVMNIYNKQQKKYSWINVDDVPVFRNNEKKPYVGVTVFM